MDWHEIFEYRDGELYWKVKAKRGRMKVGDRAGCISNHYCFVKYKQTQYTVHRTIWEMHHGKIKRGLFIDHIDGNGLNNKIENLRLVTPEGNTRNARRQLRNKSGVTGIRWDGQRGKWFVHITLKSKMYNLGRYETKEEAISVRKKAEKRNGFHPNHGRSSADTHLSAQS